MRIGLGFALAASVLAGAVASSSGWIRQSEVGLRQLMTGTITANPAASPGHAGALADWRDPSANAKAARVVMSESEWLKLADDLAPVSYLSGQPADPPPVATTEQQPL